MEKKRGVGGGREGKETKEYWEEEGRGEVELENSK